MVESLVDHVHTHFAKTTRQQSSTVEGAPCRSEPVPTQALSEVQPWMKWNHLLGSPQRNSLAAAISGLSFAIKAALQQSIMPCMLHSPSPKCRGTPANVLPASISKRNKDASRFFMFCDTLFNTDNRSQPLSVGLDWPKYSIFAVRKIRAPALVKFFSFVPPFLRNFSRPL